LLVIQAMVKEKTNILIKEFYERPRAF
jgi:hypothetical protein